MHELSIIKGGAFWAAVQPELITVLKENSLINKLNDLEKKRLNQQMREVRNAGIIVLGVTYAPILLEFSWQTGSQTVKGEGKSLIDS